MPLVDEIWKVQSVKHSESTIRAILHIPRSTKPRGRSNPSVVSRCHCGELGHDRHNGSSPTSNQVANCGVDHTL